MVISRMDQLLRSGWFGMEKVIEKEDMLYKVDNRLERVDIAQKTLRWQISTKSPPEKA